MKVSVVADSLAVFGVIVALSSGECLWAQDRPERSILDASAGLFFGDRSSYNGPVFDVRYGIPLKEFLFVGLRGEYRDDDPSGGRVEVLALGLEAILASPEARLYVPGAIAVEHVSVRGASSPGSADARPGFHVAGSVGLGVALPTHAFDLLVEARVAFGPGGAWNSLSVGTRSRSRSPQSDRGWVYLQTNTLRSFNGAYRPDPDFRGYGISYQHPLHARPIGDWRVSLGIDFLRFTAGREWSTGTISALFGIGVPLYVSRSGNLAVSGVANAGALLFAEPSGEPPYPVALVGLEARACVSRVGVFGALSGVLGRGPAGSLTGRQMRFGLAVGL